jgi:cardiolipin synthase
MKEAVPMTTIRPTAPALRVVPKTAAPAPAAKAKATNMPAVVTPAEKAVMTAPTSGNKITLHVDASDADKALLDSIKNAKKSFYIETFIWHNDAAGNEVIDALAKKVADAKAKGETFDAKVLIDWFGLRQGTGGTDDTAVVEKLKAAGVQVEQFSPGYIKDGMITPITHQKLYIQDGTQFITGGRNIGNEYLHETFHNDATNKDDVSWHDLLYTVEGPETARIITEFFKNWKRAGGTVPAELPATPSRPVGTAKVQSFITDPRAKVKDLQKSSLGLIANAQKEIVAIYPYFSDDKLVQALIDAKKKNPKLTVKVMMPANKEAGREGQVYTLLNKLTARQLMAAGIEVRMFAGGSVKGQPVDRFSHFKGMIIDQQVLSIGSGNGDGRTFNKNHELNTIISDKAAANDFLAQVVNPDWAAAEPVTQKDLDADSLWTRIKQQVLEVFDFML